MTIQTEQLILKNLVGDEKYSRKCLPFLKSEYFEDYSVRLLFQVVHDYITKYNNLPPLSALRIEINSLEGLTEQQYQSIGAVLSTLSDENNPVDYEWLVDHTEKYCQERAIYIALSECISITHGGESTKGRGAIPTILSDALAVSFDTSIGHDYIDDWRSRYENYHRAESKIRFDLELLNKITKGGLPGKTLTVILAGTGGGKSRLMAHCAANNLRDGKNVLYITLEMSEYSIAERVDANLLDVEIGRLRDMGVKEFEQRITRIKNHTSGKFILKEYPTASASALNFKHLIDELRIKRKFVPDILYVDYINICTSHRFKPGANVGSYQYIKAIAEELRSLAVDYNIPVVTATQLNRSGFTSSDVGLEDTAESFGLPATADLMFALINTDELNELDQQLVKQLKNRFNDPSYYGKFVIGIDKKRMRYYDVDSEAQEDLDGGPIMDKTDIGQRLEEERDSFKTIYGDWKI